MSKPPRTSLLVAALFIAACFNAKPLVVDAIKLEDLAKKYECATEESNVDKAVKVKKEGGDWM